MLYNFHNLTTQFPIPWNELRLFLIHLTNTSSEYFLTQSEIFLSQAHLVCLSKWVKRRQEGEPISKIVEKKEFFSLPFKTNAFTLDPRPDSETLIDAVFKNFPDFSQPYVFLDLGTGSGCLLITLLHHYKEAKGIGVDLSFEALKVSRENSKRLGVDKRSLFVQSSWLDSLKGAVIDIIVSNPPYISTQEILLGEVLYDPPQALYGGVDGLDAYRQIFSQLYQIQFKKCFFEIGYLQSGPFRELCSKLRFPVKEAYKDLSQVERVFEI